MTYTKAGRRQGLTFVACVLAFGGMTAGPARSQNVAAAPVEARVLTHNATRVLRGGDVLAVRLQGTPGASGTFTLGGVEGAQNLPLTETTPGVYEGIFPVAAGVYAKNAVVSASLTLGNASPSVKEATNPLTIDAVAPTLASLAPENGSTLTNNRPLVYGTYADTGTGVDAQSARLLVNDQDVTKATTRTEVFFSFRPDQDLPAGKNTARVFVKDGAGNETQKDWTFTIAPGEPLIKSVTFTPQNKTLGMGDVLSVRLEAGRGGTARFSVGGLVTDRELREKPDGVYAGSYTVNKGDTLNKGRVSVAYTSPSGRTETRTAAEPVTILAAGPDIPIIDSPQQDAAVGNSVTVSGRAGPNATVRVSVVYHARLLFIPARGTVTEVEVKADAQGRWTLPDIKLSAPPGVSRLEYTVRAVAVDDAGEKSDPATVQFRR